ncbi:hypothetical protein BV20DRAFT_776935 [Pilatotrama ljubarskyi]|nr:hypothetical protein BV20DRAFT_776935 [Pilatotrama ljubarskyi]
MSRHLTPASVESSSGPALRAFLDSGAPEGSSDYTTLVIIHGLGWHAANFKKLLPLAKEFNTRIVLVNRRDYPGSSPYTPDERANLARLASSSASPEGAEETASFIKQHARDIYDFLADFVKRQRIPAPQGHIAGGIVLVGWSLGCLSMTAFLANVGSFPVGDVALGKYVRRVVLYEPWHGLHGYPYPPDYYHPLHDASLSDSERLSRFDAWVSSYFDHGDVWTHGAAALEFHTPAADPPSTASRMTAAELAESTYAPPVQPGGSELLLIQACNVQGIWAPLKDRALYLSEPVPGADNWRDVEVRYVWGDRSTWEMLWCEYLFSKELEEARAAGEPLRNIDIVHLKGANHFAHWDMPEQALKGFLGTKSSRSRM